MNDGLDEIRSTIRDGDAERARNLLRIKLMSNPTAEIYYLSAQVARNDEQRLDFLEKSLALDPFHAGASDALAVIKHNKSRDPFVSEPQPEPTTSNAQPSMMFPGNTVPNAPPTRAAPNADMTRYQLADFGTRFIAYFIDGLVILLAILPILLFVMPLPSVTPEMTEAEIIEIVADYQNRALIITFLIQSAYYVYFLARNEGQTIGKRVMKIRVARLDGRPISFLDAALRNVIGYALSGFFLFAGFFWPLIDSKRQAWHDKLVNTVVIKAEQ